MANYNVIIFWNELWTSLDAANSSIDAWHMRMRVVLASFFLVAFIFLGGGLGGVK